MRFMLVVPILAVLTTAPAAPAYAQYARTYGPGIYGPHFYGPFYRERIFRGAYGAIPGPFFYNDGWVPESIYDRSRVGNIDPTIRPSGS